MPVLASFLSFPFTVYPLFPCAIEMSVYPVRSEKRHGQILLVVDQPATIGALPVAVARSEGTLVGYLPGLAMRRIADLHAG